MSSILVVENAEYCSNLNLKNQSGTADDEIKNLIQGRIHIFRNIICLIYCSRSYFDEKISIVITICLFY